MKYVDFLMKFHQKKQSKFYKWFSLFCGSLFFLAILPAIFIWVGFYADSVFSLNGNTNVRYIISIISMCFGLYFLFWSTFTQLRVGKGTPAPNAPTQKLIVSGPYKLTRNPIEFGAIFYYFGLGTIIQSYTVGIVCALLGFILGSIYHKFIEEKELERRFGDDYINYRKEVPFLIPHCKKH
jgi:protein-S-isoprenylcysteine O-methyltransferase Ste14